MRFLGATFLAVLAVVVLAGPASAQDRNLEGLLGDLEQLLKSEKEKPDHDQALVERLERLIRRYRGGGGSGGEDSGGGGGGGGAPGGRGPRGGGGSGVERILDRVLGDVELDEKERQKVVRILSEFYESWQLVRMQGALDSLPDISKDRDNRLGRAIGKRRAKSVSENIDAIVRRWNWGGRR